MRVILVISFAICLIDDVSACDGYSSSECSENFKNVFGGWKAMVESMKSPQGKRLYCQAYEKYVSCMRCIQDVDFDAIDNQLHVSAINRDACRDDKEKDGYNTCIEGSTTQAKIQNCKDSSNFLTYYTCSTLNITVMCIGEAIYEQCGHKAAEYFTKVEFKVLSITIGSCPQVELLFGESGNNPFTDRIDKPHTGENSALMPVGDVLFNIILYLIARRCMI